VKGEVYIGGEGLARGYLSRPDLTADRFLPDPKKRGERLYRTGDEARWLESGDIEFLGRRDGQVKIRGYRIETGEVEAALEEIEGVNDAVVVVRDEGMGKQLVAFVVLEGEHTGAELRRRMRERQPEYMVPNRIEVIDELPLTANGKVDRRALANRQLQERNDAEQYLEPRNEVEEKIAQIWKEVLGIERVGVDDNFFDLGGHSLLATQVISRVRERFNTELPLRQLFEMPTVANLAAVIGENQKTDGDHITRRIGPGTAEDILSRIGDLSDEEVHLLLETVASQEHLAQ
jgi:acyl carrier protein